MGLMTMARDHRQANGQFKEEPGNDSVSFLLHFSKKVKQDPSTPPSRWRHFHTVVPICTSYSALLPASCCRRSIGRITLHISSMHLHLPSLEAHWPHQLVTPASLHFGGVSRKRDRTSQA